MRLNHIKLAGFKSFVDPTVVSFPSNLVGIVGPNGCGKSNVIDAVRWVLGEMSAKTLRGEAMTDVIFNGTDQRKPVGQASVELVFDNSDHTLKGEYAAYNEISIKRVVTRDSQSGYFLNGTKCRRRDIQDIFLGTGLGPRSYSIIEQGMISRLIEAKPDELRVYVEEAAGISKYKERRRDTENRISRTRENLERLTDIREELERQLQHLKRQAAAAEKYTEFKAEERQLNARLEALRWKQYDEEAGRHEQHIRELEVDLESRIARTVSFDTEIEKQRLAYTEQSDVHNEISRRYYELGAEVSRIEANIEHVQDRIRQLREDLEQTERSAQESEANLNHDRNRIAGWDAELIEIVPQLEIAQARETESAARLQVADELMQAWQQEWDDFNHAAMQPRQQAEVQQSRLQHIEKLMQRMQERITRLDLEKGTLVSGPEEAELQSLRTELSSVDQQLETRQASMEANAEQIETLRDTGIQLGQQLDELRSEQQSMRGRHASLEALQQAARGEHNEAVTGWLHLSNLGHNARVADKVKVDSKWQRALETVLGSFLQAVCVDDIDVVASVVDKLEQGSVCLVESHALSRQLGKSTYLADYVVEAAGCEALLDGIYAVNSLQEAMALRKQLAANESVVTLDGVWMGNNWLRLSNGDDSQAGILARTEELHALNIQIVSSQQKITATTDLLLVNREALKQEEHQREALRREITELGRQHGDVRSRLSAREATIEQLLVRRKQIDQESDEAREQMRAENEHEAEARVILAQSIESMERDNQRREELLKTRDERRQSLDETRQAARHDRDKAHELAMRQQSLTTQLASLRESIDRMQVQTERLQERRESIQTTLVQTDDPVGDLRTQLESALQQRVKVEEDLTAARQKQSDIEHALREAEQQRSRAEMDAQSARSRLEQERLAAQESQLRRKTTQERIAEAQYNLEELLQSLPADADAQVWEADLQKIRNRIQQLGAINLAAIDEYQSSSERKVYLDAQDADLVEALETLENAIRKIDRETRTRFKETFEALNKNFQELFPKIFGGGHAWLEMTGEDLLDTGVTIMARPPGKKNSTIHLLSGGEKAMTAIALVFSIFRLSPSPFCMLDEVDAPLDDSNVSRYAEHVKEMSKTVQFIFITHNKLTMEAADHLMGVTQHEKGVSRLVSVDVDQAVELAEA